MKARKQFKGVLVLIIAVFAASAASALEWDLSGYLNVPRYGHTATLLPSGEVLVAGGRAPWGYANDVEIYDPTTGSWRWVAPLHHKRAWHTATLLQSGKVLIAGGYNTYSVRTAEVYDPWTDTWEEVAQMEDARKEHTATLLPSGHVLVVGGFSGSAYLSSTEIFDPDSQIWSPGSPLIPGRALHTATLLPAGDVLVTGGYNGKSLTSAVVYSPATDDWSATGNLATPRHEHTSTLLTNGRVLVVAGGNEVETLATAEVFDPSQGIWEAGGNLAVARNRHSATLLPSGKLAVVGGVNTEYVGAVEIYDSTTGVWTLNGHLKSPRREHTATLLSSGQLLVAAGVGHFNHFSSSEISRHENSEVVAAEPLQEPRQWHRTTLLKSGHVLVTAGMHSENGSVTVRDSTEVYDPEGGWTAGPKLPRPRQRHTATLLQSGHVLVTGGVNTEGHLDDALLYDPATHQWLETGSMLERRREHEAILLPSGNVLVTGGLRDGVHLASAELYNPDSESWSTTAGMGVARIWHTLTLLQSGEVLVVGGHTGTNLATAEIYSPTSGTWRPTASLRQPRHLASATLLPSGRVLVVGGQGESVNAAELFDPATESWELVSGPFQPRFDHSAVLLPSGRVWIAGGLFGESENAVALSGSEFFDPKTRMWTAGPGLGEARGGQSATVLHSGRVLLAGGGSGVSTDGSTLSLASSEIFSEIASPSLRAPVILETSPILRYGQPLTISGLGFRGDSEGSSGNMRSSPSNIPLVRLQAAGTDDQVWLTPDAIPLASNSSTITISRFPPTMHPGNYFLSVIVAGIPSQLVPVEVECSLEITAQPLNQTAVLGETVTFRVESQGGRRFQWQRDGVDIPGATEASYTSPPITNADAGTAYRVRVGTGCTEQISQDATISIADDDAPDAHVLHPSGGELWPLTLGHVEDITWSMSDNVRICQVRVSLIYSDDSGETWSEWSDALNWPATLGSEGACPHPGEVTTTLPFEMPDEPPSGRDGSLYKMHLRVTDQAGNVTETASARPFYMKRPNPDVRTLILSHGERLRQATGSSAEQMATLIDQLQNLAGHHRVQGTVIELEGNTSLETLYQAWDDGTGTANDVLFAEGGLHDHLLEVLVTFPDALHVLVVGDDRVIPMARILDRTTAFPESSYQDLTPESTVAQALANDRFLSDDPLGFLHSLRPHQLDDEPRLPSLGIGRLVETPDEIVRAIATFISRDGVLDLSLSPEPQVMVTSYDFLGDAGERIRDLWAGTLGEPGVDGELLNGDWGYGSIAERQNALRDRLASGFSILSLNGHATHYAEGVPGQDRLDIQGLDAIDVYGQDACGSPTAGALDMSGALIYAVGCHGGLSVPGSCAYDADRSLDLPQTFLAAGASAYMANTGFGWGLRHGVGLSEKLMLLFTEGLSRGGGLVTVGDLVKSSKQRYVLESPRFDVYDAKTVAQWTLYGFPMYAVRLDAELPDAPESADPDHLGPVTVHSELNRTALPPYMTRLELRFQLDAEGVYRKYDAVGDLIEEAGCPHPDGCYYTLNGIAERALGESDLPIEPYLVYASSLSGTRQHGVLWMGGDYSAEDDWNPVIAELVSNNPTISDGGPLPRTVMIPPTSGHGGDGGPSQEYCPHDPSGVDSLAFSTGMAVGNFDDGSETWSHRLFQEVELEALYFNSSDPAENCDLQGPELGTGPFHALDGTTLRWSVEAFDFADVWRVVVVWDDEIEQAWRPLELDYNAVNDRWEGSLSVPDRERLTYVLQAVDRRGNVSWKHFAAPLPPSGVELGLADTIEVTIQPSSADFWLEVEMAPDPVYAGDPIRVEATVHNAGPDPASGLTLSGELPEGAAFLLAGGPSWACDTEGSQIDCIFSSTISAGATTSLEILLLAPGVPGTAFFSACLTAHGADPVTSNDCGQDQVPVIDGTMADLEISKSQVGSTTPGAPVTWTLSIINYGPSDAQGARVLDLFPTDVTDVQWSCVATSGSTCAPAGSGDIDEWVDIQAEGILIFTATGLLASHAHGAVVNTATVEAPPETADYDLTNNTSTASSLSDAIFADGFEAGDCERWSACVPPITE